MTRTAVFIAAFLSAGASIQSATANDMVQQQHKTPGLLRGGSRRTTSTPPPPPPPPPPQKDAPVCSSIGCPDNYAPIANAGDVECRGGECSVEQCCEAMCACFACPDNYTPIESELYELCDGGECTKEQCCETEAPKCNEIACPDNYAPVENAWDVECRGGKCSVEQCCEAMCACFACPDNYTPIDDAVDVLCTDGECTKQQCCNRHDGDGGKPEEPRPRPEDPKHDDKGEEPEPTEEPRPKPEEDEPEDPKHDDKAKEPEPTEEPRPKPEEDKPAEDPKHDDKEEEEAKTCASFECPRDTDPRGEEVQHELCVGAYGCTPEQCCKPIEREMPKEDDKTSPPPPPPEKRPEGDASVYCKNFRCPAGYRLLDGVGWVECFAEECETDECCVKDLNMPKEEEVDHDYCSSVRCPPETHRPIEGADTKRCTVVDFTAPPPPPPAGPRDAGSYSYEFVDYFEDDFMASGGGGGRPEYSYDYGHDGEEGARGSDMYYTSWMDEEDKKEYCDLRTCCQEKEYGLWGLE